METSLLLCECGSCEHQIVIQKEISEEDCRDVTFWFHLITHQGFLKRVLVALKYIFGYKSKYGNWDCLIIT